MQINTSKTHQVQLNIIIIIIIIIVMNELIMVV